MPFVPGRIADIAKGLARSFSLPAVLAIATMLALSACAPGANLRPLPTTTDTVYRLGPGDQVRVITFGGEQLTGEFRVNDSGNIAVPLLGPVRAAGLTTNALADEITDRLRRSKLFTNPSVAVEVTSYRPIFVLGEVNHPGQYPYQPGMTVLSAVAIAGGFTYRAVTDYASIVRSINGHPVEGKVQRQTLMEPGDVLTIFERYF
jgi:polysaccharide export outer membrane protein